ncbi:High-affinity choline transporter [Echinococcus granulosus]|uniref:High-affinity choline transporter n=1 Tax=Echinococcus granulosus TaxID=6210 RepID=W6USK2_ECHGR|nr:High-affinity choline transporter [Echinococcus granulosus]EUB56419.1 High-affinity choline transporter [Echinococcus granulosus]
MVSVNIPGIVGIICFYLFILGVGLWAARKSKKPSSATRNPQNTDTPEGGGMTDSEDVMLAGRDIGLFVGVFTMTATWVGGGYINGTAEAVYDPLQGLLLCQAPIGYALSLVVGGVFFANKMRSLGYVTMLDPLQAKYGERMCGLLFIPALLGEIFWSAAILAALGATIAVVIGINGTISVIVSACIAMLYTLFGGLYAVAYTDVVQLFCIFVARGAQMLSYMASLGCLIMAIPSILIGAVAASTDWSATEYNGTLDNIIIPSERKLVLPLVLQYLCPPAVSFVGLGAISAAVMSSADSSVFSAASMFAHNVVKALFPATSERCILFAMKGSILVVGGFACLLGIMIKSIYDLWFLSSDLVYVILFPQLISVLFIPFTNTYGSLAGFLVGLFLRLTSGERTIGLPALFRYPGYDYEAGLQRAPVKTIAMLGSLVVSTLVSYLMHRLWLAGKLEGRRDFFRCMRREAQAPVNGHSIISDTKEIDAVKAAEVSIKQRDAVVKETEQEKEEEDEEDEEEREAADAGVPLTTFEKGKTKPTKHPTATTLEGLLIVRKRYRIKTYDAVLTRRNDSGKVKDCETDLMRTFIYTHNDAAPLISQNLG